MTPPGPPPPPACAPTVPQETPTMPPSHVIRTRPLPAHLHTPTLHTVYDVTETTTPKPVPFGVHTSPGRAVAHRDRLNAQAAAVREAEEQEAREQQEKARARREERLRREADQEHTEEEGR